MNNTTTILLNGKVSNAISKTDLIHIRLICPFCKKQGPKKVFYSLWCYSRHLFYHHKSELERNEITVIVSQLRYLIGRGVLK